MNSYKMSNISTYLSTQLVTKVATYYIMFCTMEFHPILYDIISILKSLIMIILYDTRYTVENIILNIFCRLDISLI